MLFVIQPFSYFFFLIKVLEKEKMSLYKFGDCMNLLKLFATCQKELPIDWKHYLAVKCAWIQWEESETARRCMEKGGEKKTDTPEEGETEKQKWGVTSSPSEEKAALLHWLCAVLLYIKRLLKCWWNPEPQERWSYFETPVWDFVVYIESLFFTHVNTRLAASPLTRQSAENT